jgi:hypothetical protein
MVEKPSQITGSESPLSKPRAANHSVNMAG